jgi:hypothetical protein
MTIRLTTDTFRDEVIIFICALILYTVGTGGTGYEIGKHVWQKKETPSWPANRLHSNEVVCWQNRENSVAICGYLDTHGTFVQFAVEPRCLDAKGGSFVPCSFPVSQ